MSRPLAAWVLGPLAPVNRARDRVAWLQEMRFKYPGQDWTAWEPFAPYKYVSRPIASGSCTIYLQCRDAVGNESAAVSDSINLLP